MKARQVRFPQLEDEEWLGAQLAAGRTQAAIAAEVGCSAVTVAFYREVLDLPRPRRFPQLDEPGWLAAQLAAGRSQPEIAKTLGCSRQTVVRRVAALQLQVGVPRYGRLEEPGWLAAQLEAGRLQADIAAEVGCAVATVIRHRQILGIPSPQKTKRRLSDAEVLELRELVASTRSLKPAMERFGLGGATVSAIAAGKCYRDAPGPITPRCTIPRGCIKVGFKLTPQAVAVIKAELAAGEPQRDLARAWGISKSMVSMIARGECWSHIQPAYREDEAQADVEAAA